MYQAPHKRLEISVPMLLMNPSDPPSVEGFTPTWAWIQIKEQIMKPKEHWELEGMAPPRDLERKIQEFLDAQEQK